MVAAADGYPGAYAKNDSITLSEPPKSSPGILLADLDSHIFHAGTTITTTGELITAGGRVIAATAVASDLKSAVSLAYEAMKSIEFQRMHFRKDIAYRWIRLDVFLTIRAFRRTSTASKTLTYASAGVSIEAGNLLVEKIKPFVKATHRPGANAEIGGFGGIFNLRHAGYHGPILVAGIDGIGTKIKVAQAVGRYDTIGNLHRV